MRRPTTALTAGLVLALLATLTSACTDGGDHVTLRVLASPELADVAPLLAELEEDTGVELELDYTATADLDGQPPAAGRKSAHDLAWLASDRSFLLRLQDSAGGLTRPESTSIMRSPVVVGLTPRRRP